MIHVPTTLTNTDRSGLGGFFVLSLYPQRTRSNRFIGQHLINLRHTAIVSKENGGKLT